MSGPSVPKQVRRLLYAFARRLARPYTDSRRRRFLVEMVTGLIIANHVHLTKIARATGGGDQRVHAQEKRLSRHLDSEHWSMQGLVDQLQTEAVTRVGDESLIVADLTDLAKPYARALQGLGKVRDASRKGKPLEPGYMLFEAYVRVGRWQLFPLVLEPLKTYSGAPTSENAEVLAHVLAIHRATEGRGTWVLDRGADRHELLEPLARAKVALVVRQRGDRHVVTRGGRALAVEALAAEFRPARWPRRWPPGGITVTCPVWLPGEPDLPWLLVVHWRQPDREPLMLLVSPAARRAGRTGGWFVRAYRRRWGVEDATWGIKQRFDLESFLVRSWRSIRRLLVLVAWAFTWLNLWGEDRFKALREALLNHPWRLPKAVTYLFDWLASQISRMLHPRPRFAVPAQQSTG
jgi:hypothetical protein